MLTLTGIARRCAGLDVLAGLDLAVGQGGAIGLVGPNGAGKTMLLDVISGLVRPDAGRVMIGGTDATRLGPAAVARLGVARTLQAPRAFAGLTVRDNLCGAARITEAEADGLLRRFALHDRRNRPAAALSLFELRRLDLARALARKPRLLLLDEPAGGLAPAETEAVADLLREQVLPGRTALLVEHKMDLVTALCARAIALHGGRIVAEGSPAELARNEAVAEAYQGPGAALA